MARSNEALQPGDYRTYKPKHQLAVISKPAPHLPSRFKRWNFGDLQVYSLGFAPVWCLCAVVFLRFWPWQPALGHLTVLGLLGIALTEMLLGTFHKIPFTCSYLPGGSQANMAVVGFFVLLLLSMRCAEIKLNALGSRERFGAMAAILGVVAIAARWRTSALANAPESTLRFEEEPAPAIFALNLHRDGAPPA